MYIHCSRDELLRGVQTVEPAISQRATLPVLGNILIESNGESLRLSTTDLEMGIRHTVRADIVAPGDTTVPAKTLLEFLRTLDEGQELEIKTNEAHKVEIISGRNRCMLIGLPKEDFPVMPEFEEKKALNIEAPILAELIKKTIFAVSTDETRYVLNGILTASVEGGIVAVATDGRRLAYAKKEIKGLKTDFSAIIPAKTMHEILKIASAPQAGSETIAASFSGNQVSFRSKNTLVVSRLIEGHFPNYEQVIPATATISIDLSAQSLLSVTQRAAVGALERGGYVKFSFKSGQLKVSASSQGRIEVDAELDVQYKGEPLDIAFNPGYLIDVLKVLGANTVTLEMSSPLSPCLVRPQGSNDYKYVIMPMKV